MGTWKNFDELEECLSLPELDAIIAAQRDRNYNDKKFAASVQGIDIGGSKPDAESTEEKIKRIKRQAAAKAAGMSEEEAVMQSQDLPFGYEVLN